MPNDSHSHGLDFAAILSQTLNATDSNSIGQPVYGLSGEQICIYAICWVVAFCASISRSARDADSVTMLRMLGLGSSSGFLSVGFVGVWWSDPGNDSAMYFLGSSAVIGLMSKEQEKLTKMIFDRIWKLFGEKNDQ